MAASVGRRHIAAVFYFILVGWMINATHAKEDLIVVTIASNETEGYHRFMRSAKIHDIAVKVLGRGMPWKGGDMNYPGGGYKINLLKKEMEKHKDKKETVVMFVDSYDVILLATPSEILDKFKKFDANIVFSSEGFCWPDQKLVEKYPEVTQGKRFLNSGDCTKFSHAGFIGYAPHMYKIVTHADVDDKDDDQLFYTKAYLDKSLRKNLALKLDHKAQIFQNLNGAMGDVELRFRDKFAYLHNIAYATNPLVVHGNGLSKIAVNNLGNYLAKAWHPDDGCLSCTEDTISLASLKVDDYPKVMIGIFVEHPVPFLKEFFDTILNMDYPKEKVDLFIHNTAQYHLEDVEDFVDLSKSKYRSIKAIRPVDNTKEWHARNLGLEQCLKVNCDYYLSLDGEARLTNPLSLKLLIEQNRKVISPMLVRPEQVWSNFWGALTPDGYYARSSDYLEIVNNRRRGLWNMPYVSMAYLINATLLRNPAARPSYINNLLDPDMAFCKNLRDKEIFMYLTNRNHFGHLVNSDNYDISHLNNDMFQVFDNKLDWESRYIHENYSRVLDAENAVDMPCPDVFWFPVMTTQFCDELVGEMENNGQWSDGTNHDPRLAGGYENVPTRDIHMNQVGFERHWLHFLREYIRPVQEKVYPGYYHDPPQALMNFVVRYRPDEQPYLRPHHDSSTYTINVALNRPNIDYEGGGCRFLRYNCSVTATRKGWTLMHPGRLTHYHEGLPVTKGTRYIMISFVDP